MRSIRAVVALGTLVNQLRTCARIAKVQFFCQSCFCFALSSACRQAEGWCSVPSSCSWSNLPTRVPPLGLNRCKDARTTPPRHLIRLDPSCITGACAMDPVGSSFVVSPSPFGSNPTGFPFDRPFHPGSDPDESPTVRRSTFPFENFGKRNRRDGHRHRRCRKRTPLPSRHLVRERSTWTIQRRVETSSGWCEVLAGLATAVNAT